MPPLMARPLRRLVCALCGSLALVAVWQSVACQHQQGVAFLVPSARSASSITMRAAGDDFDFGDVPTGSKPPKAPATQAVATKAGAREVDDDEDDDDYDDDEEEYQRNEPDFTGSVAPFLSFVALALGSIAFIVFQVSSQNAAFSGSKNAPKIQKVQAAYSTYFADGEKPTSVE
mmetsp:Transcript_14424/g.32838  ORF Transcript_14424/g.32838 Transcript_14424/m.32838 type:complete len:174 (-) Transcript_14424:150-671(-)